MTQTLEDWHREAANLLDGARRLHDQRTRAGSVAEVNDAVTLWRHTAHVLSIYANGTETDTWSAFWGEGMSRDRFLDLVTSRSRFLRDGTSTLERDSVDAWEFDLANLILRDGRHVKVAQRLGNKEPARRIALEFGQSLIIAREYTGRSVNDLNHVLRECEDEPVTYGYVNGERTYGDHPLLQFLMANRPTF